MSRMHSAIWICLVACGARTELDVPTLGPTAGFACAVNASGVVKCWQKYSQAAVVTLPTVVDVAVGGAHAFARAQDDSVWTWGLGTACVLGTGTEQQTITSPVQVTALGNSVTTVSTTFEEAVALRTDGTVVAWGAGPNGTGGNASLCTPTPLVGLLGQLHARVRRAFDG